MSKFSIDRRALLVSSASAVVLAGCSDLIGPPAASPIYLLRPSFQRGAGPGVAWRLSIELPEAPDALDTARIAVVQPSRQMDYYANAQWPDNLPSLVQSTLVEAFNDSGRTPGVGRTTEGLKSDYFLGTDITDFQARFDVADGIPTAVVRINAKLIAAHTREVVQALSFPAEVPAGANTIPAAVDALNQALGQVVGQIVDWTLRAPIPRRD